MEVSSTRATPVQSTQQPTASQKTQMVANEGRQQQAEAMPKPVEQPKPVINTQGQTTGRLLNVTA